MKNTIVFAACMVAFSAHATCGFRGVVEDCPATPPQTPTAPAATPISATLAANAVASSSTSVSTSATSVQGQQQGQRQEARTGDVNVSVQGAQPGSGSVTVNSQRSLAVALPPAPPAVAPTMVGGVVSSAGFRCGPAVRLVAKQVEGVSHGILRTEVQDLGSDADLAPYLDEAGNVAPYIWMGGRWWGHEVVIQTGILSVSSAASLGIGGFGSSGGGNAGGGVSGGMQRMVTKVFLRLCDMTPPPRPTVAPVVVPPTVTLPPVRKRHVAQRPCVVEMQKRICIRRG